MALITCPECGKSISDKSAVCIHCGFPMAEELEGSLKRPVQANDSETRNQVPLEQSVENDTEIEGSLKRPVHENDWKARNQAALKLPYEDGIPLFVELGNEGYLMGYINAATSYDNLGDEKHAYDYYMKAYEIDPRCCGGLAAQYLGYIHARKNGLFFDEEKAIRYLKECGTFESNRPLGQIYDPCHKQNGFEAYKDASAALACYGKLISDKKSPYIASVYNDIGCIYGEVYRHYVAAACFCLLAKRIEATENRCNNYQTYLSLALKKGAIWQSNIESICSHEDINPMIERVNEQMRASKEPAKSSVFKKNGTLLIWGSIVLSFVGYFLTKSGQEGIGEFLMVVPLLTALPYGCVLNSREKRAAYEALSPEEKARVDAENARKADVTAAKAKARKAATTIVSTAIVDTTMKGKTKTKNVTFSVRYANGECRLETVKNGSARFRELAKYIA